MPARPQLTESQKEFRERMGERIRIARKTELGLSGSEMSQRVGMARGWAYQVETGIQGIDVVYLNEIMEMTNLPCTFFFTGSMGRGHAPRSLMEWQALYRNEPSRAQVHWDVDKAFRDMRAAR